MRITGTKAHTHTELTPGVSLPWHHPLVCGLPFWSFEFGIVAVMTEWSWAGCSDWIWLETHWRAVVATCRRLCFTAIKWDNLRDEHRAALKKTCDWPHELIRKLSHFLIRLHTTQLPFETSGCAGLRHFRIFYTASGSDMKVGVSVSCPLQHWIDHCQP